MAAFNQHAFPMPSPTSRNPDPTHIFGRYRLSCTTACTGLKISISYIGRQAFRPSGITKPIPHGTFSNDWPKVPGHAKNPLYYNGGNNDWPSSKSRYLVRREHPNASVGIEFKEILLQPNVHINRIEPQSRTLYMIKPSALHNLGFPQQRTTQCSTFSIATWN